VVWSVVDGQAVLPEGVQRIARYGPEWYAALARSRYVVAADLRGVAELAKPAGQRVLQTWHGVPVAPVGLDDVTSGSRLGRGWEERVRREAAQWDVLVSSGPAHTAVLRRAFDASTQVRETGLPRHDRVVSADRAALVTTVRARLGLPDGRALVLFAPTYSAERPYRRFARAGLDRYRYELPLDLDDARRALAPAATLLVRAHPKAVDAVPEADGVDVVDVTRWPDPVELVLAADVVVTDRSTLLVDAALAGRPTVLWLAAGPSPAGPPGYPDLSVFPVTTEAAQTLEAARELLSGGLTDEAALREFVATWCPLADGQAAARAVDALLAQ
jgi:CDP-glycerol glycerophosphotransferase